MKGCVSTLRYLLLLVVSLLLLGCGAPGRDTGQFESYLQKFEDSFAQIHGIKIRTENIVIKMGALDKSQLAVCTISAGPPSITINNKFWDNLSDDIKEIVLFHELGHCVIHRKHNNARGDGREWESIMEQHPQEMTDYQAHREEYLKELFLSTDTTPDELN